MQKITMNKPDHPLVDASTLKDSALRDKLLMHTGGEWEKMQKAWLSLLALPGSVVIRKNSYDKASPNAVLVVRASPYGFYGWRVRIERLKDGPALVKLHEMVGTSIQYDAITDPGEWFCRPVIIGTPGINADKSEMGALRTSAGGGITVFLSSTKVNLIQNAVKKGLPKFTVVFMRRLLFDWLMVTLKPKPVTDHDIFEAIVRHAFKHAKDLDKIVEECQLARSLNKHTKLPAAMQNIDTTLGADDEVEKVLAELADEDEEIADALRKEQQKVRETLKRMGEKKNNRRGSMQRPGAPGRFLSKLLYNAGPDLVRYGGD